ncbi:MAG TPA: 3-dehydroquinate synthase [Candidatus Dormibacteraeota bacterium]|nr:3-dehydroquinate synthase [Candidatus Dormibacteraeota bacterium]
MTGTRVTVEVPGRPYPVLVGHGVLAHLPALVADLGVTGAAVVADRAVAASYGRPLAAALAGSRGPAPLLDVEAGEQAKTLAGVERVLAFLEAAGLDRHGLVVAVGGGTIGDLAGFAAAIWLRGVRCVHVPTNLLAMVDSSVGGKTGVNSPAAKNAIGAFWQPVAVVADLATLATLPEDDYLAAFGEVVKYAVAMDAGLAARLEAERGALLARSPAALQPVVARCVELKAGVVAADEREGGPREILNYGHTVGHALESASGFTAAHGRAVAFGMKAAARIAVQVGVCDPGLVGAQDRLLDAFGLPGALPRVTADAVLEAVPRDKKRREQAVRWVLPTGLGAARTGVEVPGAVVAAVLRGLVP